MEATLTAAGAMVKVTNPVASGVEVKTIYVKATGVDVNVANASLRGIKA